MRTFPTADVQPKAGPGFTLGSALAWLEHSCSRQCSAAISSLHADIWFAGPGPARQLVPSGTLVVVELGNDPARVDEIASLVAAVRLCAERDGIAIRTQTGGGADDPGGRRRPLLLQAISDGVVPEAGPARASVGADRDAR